MAQDRPPDDRKNRRGKFGRPVGLIVVLGIALVVRLVGLGWGLPDETHLFSYHPDEFHSLRGALSLAMGDANPHFFNYGSLYLYLVAAAAAFAHPTLFSALATATPGGPILPQVLRAWTFDARVLTVLLAVGTVAVTYATARRIWGHREGLAAGLLLALAPLHVLQSHYATVDVPGAFFTALTCYFAVAMIDETSWRNVLWAGAAAGLAASVKYSGGVALIAPMMAWGITRRQKRGTGEEASWWMLVAMPVVAFVAFALTSPYTFIDWSSAWRDISFEMAHMQTGDDPAMIALYPSGWGFHIIHLGIGTGYAMLAAAAIGLTSSLMVHRRQLWPLLLFGLVVFAMIGGTQVRYARYAMPLLPVVGVFAAGVVSDDFFATVRGRFHAWGMAGAASVLIVGSVLAGGLTDYRMLEELLDSGARAEALALLEERVPEDGSIGLITEPWFCHPPVDYCNGGKALRNNPLWSSYRDPVRDLVILGLDAETLCAEEPDAVVLTGFEVGVRRAAGDEQAEAFVRALTEAGYRRTQEFRSMSWGMQDQRPRAQDLEYAFPGIEVWRRDDV